MIYRGRVVFLIHTLIETAETPDRQEFYQVRDQAGLKTAIASRESRLQRPEETTR